MFYPKDIPIVDFFPIARNVVDVPKEVHKDLSTDQGYLPDTLLKECLTVQVGRDIKQYFTHTEHMQIAADCEYNLDLCRQAVVACN